ncbi:choice-of-anchor D domain-containing protein [Ferruginibacter sp. HRS2-29]|uniref:choice-of-anchor D domain-containing protein n=1 Tax=Ferruginibacter sp. HRS2-29 TaxID=2487334 RepID=UPI0020CD78AC|nr:choice-of-anchor D domain-containing protein [Ferruginibacter sp. HRS2-29]MCP9751960.1 choice-of-anchor D domain-containing protein [Ferruginibacter sp. HRS2-29]
MKKIYAKLLLGCLLCFAGNAFGQSTYTLITSTADIDPGGKYLIVSSNLAGAAQALGSQNTNYRNRSAVTITNVSGVMTISTTPATASAGTEPFEITISDGSTGKYLLFDAVNSTYLIPATGTSANNYLNGQAAPSDWTITFATKAIITNTGHPNTNASPRNLMSHNASATRFACYSSEQGAIYLYKKASAGKYWDASTANPNTGGSATWGTTFSTVATGSNPLVTAATTDDVIFQGTGGTPNVVNLSASQTAKSITVNTNDYSITTSGTGAFSLTATNGIALGANTITAAPVSTASLTLPNVIGGTGGVTQNGSGITILGAINTYSGATTITSGTIRLGTTAGGIPDASPLSIASGAFFDMNGLSEAVGSIAGAGNIMSTVNTARTLTTGGNNTTTTFSGTLENGASVLSLIKTGTGTMTLSGNNTYTGATTIGAGVITLGAAGDGINSPLGTTGAGTSVTSGAVFDLNGITLSTAEPLTLNGTGTGAGAMINVVAAATYSGPITLGSATSIGNNANITLTGGITGIAGNTLTKNGTATLTLSGSNGYLGATTVAAGTLLINANTLVSNITVANGATLSNTGSAGTTGSAAITGTISPAGTGIGTINVGAMTWNNTGSYRFDINALPSGGNAGTNWDFITASGALTTPASGAFTVAINGTMPGFDNTLSYTWQIGTYGSGSPVSTFVTVNTSALTGVTITGSFSIVFTGGNINLVYTPPTPEVDIQSPVGTSIAVNGTRASFGTVAWGDNVTAVFRILNTGTAALGVNSINFAGINAGDFTLVTPPSFPFSVVAGGSQDITVRFAPGGIGARTANITFNNTDPDEAAYLINVSGTGTPSALSTITTDATYSYTQNIPYLTYVNTAVPAAAGGSVGVHNIIITDGVDADNLPTILNSITFTYTGTANTIRSAALFTTSGSKIADVTTVGANTLAFSGLAISTLTDGGNTQAILRVVFNTVVADNEKLVFTVTAATAAGSNTSSTFTSFGAVSDNNAGNDRNRIEVTADRLAFSTVANGSVAINLAAFTISAKDALGNTDLDRTESVDLTTSGTGMTSSTPYTLVAGVVTINNVQFASVQTGITLTGNVTTPVLTGTSNSFNISAVSYALGDYQTNPAFTGTYFFSSVTADGSGIYPWQKWTSSGWADVTLAAEAPQSLAAGSKPPTIYLAGSYIDVAAGSSYNNIVVSGAGTTVFSGNTSTGLTINSGKTLDIKGGDVLMSGRMSLTAGATLHIAANANFYVSSTSGTFLRNATSVIEVEDDGNFYLQSYLANLWTGVEKFHKNSNLYIQEWDNSSTTFLIASSTDVSTYTDGGVTAYFGNLIIDMSSSSNAQTLQLLYNGFSGYLTNHDLIFNSAATGANYAVRFVNAASYTATIGRNLIVNSTWANKPVSMLNNAGTVAVTVKGNVENNSSSGAVLRLCSTTTAGSSVALTIEGNLSTSNSGVFNFNAGTPSSGTIVSTTVNLAGDLSIGAGSNMLNSDVTNAGAVFNFNGAGDGSTAALTQTINIATTVAARNQAINFFVKPGAYVQLINQDMPLGQKSTFTVNGSGSVGGTLDFNFAAGVPLNITSYSTGTMFKSEQASTLKITSVAGISASSTPTTGNVQVTNAPNYTSLATFWYIGRAATQSTGTGLPGTASGKILICDLVDNNAELTMTSPTTITSAATLVASGGKLDIRKGKFIETTSGYIDGSTGTLYMSAGTLYKVVTGYNVATIESGGSGGTYIPRMLGSTAANPYILASGSTIELSGTGAHAFQTLRGTDGTNRTAYQNIKFSNNNILRTNYKNVSSASVVLGDITVADNAVVDAGANYLGGNNTTLTMTGNSHYITAGTGVKPDATGAYTLGANTTIEFNNKSAATLQSPRLINSVPFYANVIISGSNVGLSALGTGPNSFMQFQPLGSFTVTDTGTFKIANINGFSGGSNTAVSNVNNPSITLKAGSTIEYDGLAPDNQVISNALNTFPANAHYQNLVIGGSSDKTAPSDDLIILGNIKKYGASIFKHNDGTVKLNGTTTQNITDSLVTPQIVFNNLQVNNATGVEVKSNFSVYRTLSFNGVGKLNLNSGDISLKSDLNNTANVGKIDGTAAITYGTGRFIVERYIATNSHSRAWQFLATPTTGSQTINQAWQEGFGGSGTVGINGFGTRINGGTSANGFDGPTGVNIKSYIPSSDQWTSALSPNSTSTATINNPNGWMVFVRGDRNNTQTNSDFGNATVLRTRGQIYAPGNLPYVATTEAGKYHAIGNPYASTIDLRTLDTLNITDDIYIWDPTLGSGAFGFGRYRTLAKVGTHYEVTPVGGAYPGTIVDEIQSGQAFFVKARPGQVGTVSFSETNKVEPNKVVTRGGGVADGNAELLRVQLNTRNSAGNQEVLDGAMAIFGDFSRDLDWRDGAKFINTGENVGLRVKTLLAAIERRPSPVAGDTLHVEFSNAGQKAYQWTVTAQFMDKPGRGGWIYDKFLKNNTPVNLNGETVLDFTVTADPLSAAVDRFKIVFDKIAAPAPVRFISISATRNTDRSINVKWKVENEANITGYTIERSADGRSFTGIVNSAMTSQGTYGKDDLSPLAQDNYYRIKASGLAGEITYSEVVKVAPLSTKAYISVYPNPVEGKTAQLVFANQPAGLYQVQVINNLGQVIYNGSVKVSGYNFIYPIVLGAKTTQGNYEVKVVKEDGKVSVQKIIVN